MWFLKALGYLLGGIVLLAAVVLIGARFADGPLEIIAGGEFSSGTPYTGAEPDWAFVRPMVTVEFQLMDPARSRTTWILEHEGKIYIPCGYMNSTWGKIWKQWPIEAEKDGRAILRIDGQLYDRQLVRVQDGPEVAVLTAQIAEKYKVPATPAAVTSGDLWIFQLAPAS